MRAYFGIEDTEDVKKLMDTLLDGVSVKVHKAVNEGNAYMLALTITVFDRTWLKNVLDSPYSKYISDQDEYWSGAEIPWLKWLLLSGGAPVVFGYKVLRGSFPHYSDDGSSRTTRAIMVEADGSFSVKPEEYQGTQNDNFLTRAASSMDQEIIRIAEQAIARKS